MTQQEWKKCLDQTAEVLEALRQFDFRDTPDGQARILQMVETKLDALKQTVDQIVGEPAVHNCPLRSAAPDQEIGWAPEVGKLYGLPLSH